MDLTPNDTVPKLIDPPFMRRQMEDRRLRAFARKDGVGKLDQEGGWPPNPFVTKDGVTVDPGQGVKLFEQHEGRVTDHDNSNRCFLYNGDLYFHKVNALRAAKDYWKLIGRTVAGKITTLHREIMALNK